MKYMMTFRRLITPRCISLAAGVLFFSLFFLSCGGDAAKEYRAQPAAYGRPNEVTVVMDREDWEGDLGDSLRYYFESPYLIMPQPEPVFDLRYFSPEEFSQKRIRREARTIYLIGNLSEEESGTARIIREDLGGEKVRRAQEDQQYNLAVGRNKWSEGQIMLYQFGFSHDDLMAHIRNNFPAVKERINRFDLDRIRRTAFQGGVNEKLMSQVRAAMGVELQIPSDYKLAKKDGGLIWLRKDTRDFTNNILLYRIAYTDSTQLTRAGLMALRDSIGKLHIRSSEPGSYMRINAVDLPLFIDPTLIDGRFALEAKGIWEMVNDFSGGPFFTYLVYDQDRGELLFLDAFILAPGEDKRDVMQQMEQILRSARFTSGRDSQAPATEGLSQEEGSD